jgi:uncharacterized protein (DUF58 family)
MTPGRLAPDRVQAAMAPRGRWPWTFGPTTLRLLLVGLVLVIPAWLDRRAAIAVVAWDIVVLAAWAIDLRRLPRPAALSVSREWSGPLVLGVPQTVRLRLANAGGIAVDVRVTEFAPPSLRAAPADASVRVPASDTSGIDYEVVPSSRGDAAMDLVAVSYRSGAGLAERWAAVSLPQTVRVYPDIGEAGRQAFALIRARQIVMEKRRARAHGLGREFESLREFQQGDERRDISWTATARRGRLVARTYRPERSQTVWVVVDAGRLMRARRDRHTSLDAAVNAAFALAQVVSGAGDRVGLLVYGRGVQHRLAPARGPAHLRAWLEALAAARGETAEAAHAAAAAAVLSAQKRRALVVWLTDIAETAAVPEVIDSASHLVPQHVLVFAVPRPTDLVMLAAAVPGTERDLYRGLAAQEVVERRAALLGHLRQRGAMVVEVGAPELTGALVDRYLGVKERNLL